MSTPAVSCYFDVWDLKFVPTKQQFAFLISISVCLTFQLLCVLKGEQMFVVICKGCLYFYNSESEKKPQKAVSLFGYTRYYTIECYNSEFHLATKPPSLLTARFSAIQFVFHPATIPKIIVVGIVVEVGHLFHTDLKILCLTIFL